MTVGLPGTGIGGIFYLLLAIYMPVCEFFRMLQRQTSRLQWCFVSLQLGFVFGILATLWSEAWVLSQMFIWLQHIFGINCILAGNGLFGQQAMQNAKLLTFASASGSFISLFFVFVVVHVLRLCLRHGDTLNCAFPEVKSPVTSLKSA